MTDRPVLITGRLLFDRLRPLPSSCRIRVRVIDARWADAPHHLVAEREIDPPAGSEDVGSVPFRISVNLPRAGPHCLVTAHVDLNGDGQVGAGDLITMESYPIVTTGDTFEIDVRLRSVQPSGSTFPFRLDAARHVLSLVGRAVETLLGHVRRGTSHPGFGLRRALGHGRPPPGPVTLPAPRRKVSKTNKVQSFPCKARKEHDNG